jgi:hypothetical protein
MTDPHCEPDPRDPEHVLLGLMSASHLGDALCTTPIARELAHRRLRVWVTDHPSTRIAYANNPHIVGLCAKRGTRLHRKLRGDGHVIQRLQRGFGLPIDARPKPDIFLADPLQRWARQQRSQWPADRPVCLISTRAITDGGYFHDVDWQAIGAAWARRATLVQPILTSPELYTRQIARLPHRVREPWQAEPIIPGAVVYRDLPVERYLALFSVVDAFCGPLSGGSHAAAAFERPALIVIWPQLMLRVRFPVKTHGLVAETFIYPQHTCLSTAAVQRGQVDTEKITAAVDRLLGG